MQILYERCAGLDVHKRSVVVCLLFSEDGHPRKERQTFSTMTADVLRLRNWLAEHGCTCVAMESTGVFWKPIYNLLEGHFQVLVVNAQHIKTVPGRKTAVKDAEWIADLLQHGLLRPSFIPPAWQRSLRELTRARSVLTQKRTRVIARLQKGLEDANIKLASVVSDVMGTSAQHMLQALVQGDLSPTAMAELARGRMRPKREQLTQALTGSVQAHHCLLITEYLAHIRNREQAITRLSADIAERQAPYEELLVCLETVPGINRRIAEIVLAEIGPDMGRVPSAAHLASWAACVLATGKARANVSVERPAKAVSGCAPPSSKQRTQPLTVRSRISQLSTIGSPFVVGRSELL